jgi:transposase
MDVKPLRGLTKLKYKLNANIMYKYQNPKDELLIPLNYGEVIPDDAPVRLVNEIVDNLDLSKIEATYAEASKGGKFGYSPRTLLKLILFGYMNNCYSTRDLECQCKQNINYMWLSSSTFPDHITIHRFKKRCVDFIKEIFQELVKVLVELGEISLSEDLYIDGTTIRSRAARRKIYWRKTAERFSSLANEKLQEALSELTDQIDEPPEDESAREGHTDISLEEARKIAKRIKEKVDLSQNKEVDKKLQEIEGLCKRKEKHDEIIKKCEDRCGFAPADPECGVMHAKEDGYDQRPTPNYNVQMATQNQYVINYDVSDKPNDKDTAVEFIEECIKENGVKPQAVVEDAGYGCEELYVKLEELGIEAVVKYQNYDAQCVKRPAEKYNKFGFRLTEDGNGLICPAGHIMNRLETQEAYTKSKFRSDVTFFSCDHCSGCKFKDQCSITKNKDNKLGRKLGNLREEEKAKRRLDKPINQERLKRRSLEPEPVFGNLKYNHGYNRFRHFGKAKVKMDLGLMCMALNLRKLYNNTKKLA